MYIYIRIRSDVCVVVDYRSLQMICKKSFTLYFYKCYIYSQIFLMPNYMYIYFLERKKYNITLAKSRAAILKHC